MKQNIPFLLIIAFGISACNPSTRAPTPVILADSFFSGYAFLDANGNEQIDPGDTPLQDAIFIVQFEGGAEFGALTDQTGNAFVTIPSAVKYPVTLMMKPPKDSALVLIGPAKIILQGSTSEKTSFLFASK